MNVHATEIKVMNSPVKYWVYGNPAGNPCILVHGFRGDHHGLEKIAAEILQKDASLQLIIPDLPGFGETPAVLGQIHTLALYGAHLAEFAELVTDKKYTILAHSFGSLVTSAALQYGLKPTSIVLVNPISRPALEGSNKIMSIAAKQYYELGRRLPKKIGHKILSNGIATRVMSKIMAKTKDKELEAWIHAEHDRYFGGFNDRDALAEAFDASISNTVTDFVPYFTMPTLVLAGEKDELASTLEQFELAQKMNDAKMQIIYGTGHLSHYETPDEVAHLAVSFWENL